MRAYAAEAVKRGSPRLELNVEAANDNAALAALAEESCHV